MACGCRGGNRRNGREGRERGGEGERAGVYTIDKSPQ